MTYKTIRECVEISNYKEALHVPFNFGILIVPINTDKNSLLVSTLKQL